MPQYEVQGVGVLDFPEDSKPDEVLEFLNAQYPAQKPPPERKEAPPRPQTTQTTIGAPQNPLMPVKPDMPEFIAPPLPTVSPEEASATLSQKWYQPPPEFRKPLAKIGTFLFSHPSPELRDRIAKGDKDALVESGVAESLAKNIDALSTPENLTLMAGSAGIGAVGPVARRAVAGGFAYLVGKQAPQLAAELGSELGKPKDEQDPKKIAELVTDAAVTTGLTAAAAAGALSGATSLLTKQPRWKAMLPSAMKEAARSITEDTKNASRIREDAGQVPTRGGVEEGRAGQGSANLEQPTPRQPSGEPPPQPVQAQEGQSGTLLSPSERYKHAFGHEPTPEQLQQVESGGVELPEAKPVTSPPNPNLAGPGTPAATQLPDIPTKSPIVSRMSDSLRNIWTGLKGIGGHSMPKTTAESRGAGEAGVRYASSRIAARPLAKVFEVGTLEGTGVDPVEFGAALTEDNLRSVKKGFEDRAADFAKKGDLEAAAAAKESADNVHSLIGREKSPFKTEQEYQDYLKRPEVQKAIKQHIDQWEHTIEPQFKAAQSIDPDTELPTRGLQTGARINLKAIQEGDEVSNPIRGTGASLTATFKKKSPFGREAKGTGQDYETHYGEIIHNTFHKQLEIANKNLFDKALVESGNAAIAPPGQTFNIGGEGTTAFPLQRRIVITDKSGKTRVFNKGENIYVRNSLASEYRTAANVDKKFDIPVVTPVLNFLNRTALAGLTDATVHVSNQMTALFSRPASSKLLTDTLLSATGRADVPVTLTKAIVKAFKNNDKQLAELAEIGALREETRTINPLGKLLQKTDRLTRLVLDDTFKSLADAGVVDNTETARREYVNQIGQYNRRLQGPMTKFFRDTGFGPFVTAGKTFNALGVKNVTLSPGAKASSNLAAAALRANLLSKWVGAAVTVGTLNYLLTSKNGGGVMGRPGVPIGNIDSGKDDEQGRPLSIPALDILGLGRGLRVTGAKGYTQSKYLGLSDDVAFDAAARDIINSAVSPFAGPGPRFAKIAATGSPIAINVGRTAPVVPPGQNQMVQNIKSAAIEANPVVKSVYSKVAEGKSLREAVAGQLPRFTLTSGKPPEMMENYPEIVHKAQLGAYLDDVVHRARKMSDEQRGDYLEKVKEGLEPEDWAQAERTFKWRKVQ